MRSTSSDNATEPEAVPRFAFDNSYARLPAQFFARLDPTPVASPRLIKFNHALAEELGLDAAAFDTDFGAAIVAGNLLPQGAEPLAMAYAGHQFGHFVPQLGDGRAILLGEVIDRNGRRRDIQLKGAGRTPFSRRGDGRAALGPVLREYLVSEAMHALGIPTTRALAAVTTGERVHRETIMPGAMLTRVAASHIRVGTFQYFAARGDTDAIRLLADHAIERHAPRARDAMQPYLALLAAVVERQAILLARWMQVGFIHGVMNTDNTTISGETIDFGPCAFMDGYDPGTVFSAIDHTGRYAYANQPRIAQWNLARFAETLLPLIDPEPQRAVDLASEAIAHFATRYDTHWLAGMRRKLGLFTVEDEDRKLIQALLDAMHAKAADFTQTFRRLCDAAQNGGDPDVTDEWLANWRTRLLRDPQAPAERAAAMRATNPAIIPRNHRVEHAIEAAIERDDFAPFHALNEALSHPYEDRSDTAAYAEPPQADERVLQTFCGT